MKTSQAIKRAGSISALARALGITRQSIQKWGEAVPKRRTAVVASLSPKRK